MTDFQKVRKLNFRIGWQDGFMGMALPPARVSSIQLYGAESSP